MISVSSQDQLSNVPDWLRQIPRWILWRLVDGRKVPHSVVSARPIDITDPNMGWPFELAIEALSSKRANGVGIILNGDPLVCIDIDDCLSEACELKDGLQQLLDSLGAAYVEISPSGRGLHVFGFAEHNCHPGVRAQYGELAVELYCTARYITVTGCPLPGYSAPYCSADLPGYKTLLGQVTIGRANQSQYSSDHLTQETQETHEVQEFQEIQETQDIEARGKGLFARMPSSCRVDLPGQRNAKCFQLARWLKAEFPDATMTQLKPVVRQWHAMFLDVMDTKDFSETWVDFSRGWDKVKIPYGQHLDEIFSDLPDLPTWMADHDLGPLGDKLLRLCVMLSERANEGRFFLSGHGIAPHLACTAQRTYQLIDAAISCGYIHRVAEGRRTRAAEYILGQ